MMKLNPYIAGNPVGGGDAFIGRADELVRAIRADTPFEEWLRVQELDHLLTRKEREQLGQVVRGAVQVLGQGATTLVEAFAKGMGESLVGGA